MKSRYALHGPAGVAEASPRRDATHPDAETGEDGVASEVLAALTAAVIEVLGAVDLDVHERVQF